MATGISSYLADKWLDALGNNTSFAVTACFVKLHVGDPGAAGTANPSDEVSRRQVGFGAASGGALVSDGAVSWVNISGSQDSTHFSVWDDLSAGNFLFSGTIVANSYLAGDTFTIPAGALTVGLTVAS